MFQKGTYRVPRSRYKYIAVHVKNSKFSNLNKGCYGYFISSGSHKNWLKIAFHPQEFNDVLLDQWSGRSLLKQLSPLHISISVPPEFGRRRKKDKKIGKHLHCRCFSFFFLLPAFSNGLDAAPESLPCGLWGLSHKHGPSAPSPSQVRDALW